MDTDKTANGAGESSPALDGSRQTCRTCARWTEGRFGLLGECSAECEGTVATNRCKIGLWIPRAANNSSSLRGFRPEAAALVGLLGQLVRKGQYEDDDD